MNLGLRETESEIALLKGDIRGAKEIIASAYSDCVGRKDRREAARMAVLLARAELASGNQARARELLEYSIPILESFQARYEATLAMLLLGAALPEDDPERLRAVEVALQSCRLRGYDMLPLRNAFLLRDVLPGTVSHNTCSPAAVESAPPIEVNMLGNFRIKRSGGEVGEKEWKTQKARSLLEYIIYRRGQWVQADTLIDLFWPHLDPDAARHNLQVTLHVIRRILEPDLGRRVPSRYILYRNNMYCFDASQPVKLDVDDFVSCWEQMKRSLELKEYDAAVKSAMRGVELYRGDYLENSAYEDWTAAPRERLLSIYIEMLHQLVALKMQSGRYDEAIGLCKKILAKDPLDEKACQSLIRCYGATGNRGEAVREYKRCRAALLKETGIPPSNTTKLALKEAVKGTSMLPALRSAP